MQTTSAIAPGRELVADNAIAINGYRELIRFSGSPRQKRKMSSIANARTALITIDQNKALGTACLACRTSSDKCIDPSKP